jgi:hypothetical protein
MKLSRIILPALGGLLFLGSIGGTPAPAKADTTSTALIAVGAAAIVGAEITVRTTCATIIATTFRKTKRNTTAATTARTNGRPGSPNVSTRSRAIPTTTVTKAIRVKQMLFPETL